MSNFLQVHTLTSYAPSCLNRDEQGRPKSVFVGNTERLRISSQCQKHWWRHSDVFRDLVGEHLGIRTRNIGLEIIAHLTPKGIETDEKKSKAAKDAAKKITALTTDGKDVVFLWTRAEWARALEAAEKLASGEITEISPDDVFLLEDSAVDVALWGRMLAAEPKYSREAACQVAHAITTHRVRVDDDYFSATDDRPRAEGGAGHVDRRQFGAGTFYGYVCLDRDLLVENLRGDEKLAALAIEGLVRAVTTVSPGAMQSTMASRSPAAYVLAEVGSQQPRSLASAFTRPVWGKQDQLGDSVAALDRFRSALAAAYGVGCDAEAVIDLSGDRPHGRLSDILDLALGRAQLKEAAE